MNYSILGVSLVFVGLLISCSGDSDEPTDCTLSLVPNPTVAAQCGQATGAVTLATSGEKGLISYQLDGGPAQRSATFDSLTPGTYSITAQDESGCTATASVTIPDEEKTITVATAFTPSPCNQSEGSISLEASGGTAPYSYRLDSAEFTDESTLHNLSPGAYTVTIRDTEGCTTRIEARIPSGIRFDDTIKEIIASNCAIMGCHVAGGRHPNFEMKDNIFANAAQISERTAEKSMPPPNWGRLTEEQIAQIDCWVGDGAPDN